MLAAVTGTPRSTVKAYVVNAHNGGQLLKLVVGAYQVLQDGRLLDKEDGRTLYDIFFTRRDIVPGQTNGLSVRAEAARRGAPGEPDAALAVTRRG